MIDERHFPGRQGRLLFAYLVTEHGRPVPRDMLADVLWGDAPPATWDKALSVLVSKLRGVLAESGVDGASVLTAAFGCYQLDLPEGTWVDVLAAESAAKEAEGFLEADEPESATARAALAESVTRNPFLPGDDGPWVEEKRRELAGLRARALSALAEASLRTDKAAEAARWASLAVEAEPFRESGYRLLMQAHVVAGNRGEALRVHERCRRLLADELGAYPSPETESIYRSLLEAPSGRVVGETRNTTAAKGASPPASGRRRQVLAAAAVVVLVAAGTAIAFLATRGDGSKLSSAARALPRVALVVPRSPLASDDPSKPYRDAINLARTQDGIQTQTFKIDLSEPGLPGRVRRSIGNFDLVLLAGQFVDARFAGEFARHRHTKFVVIDPDPFNGGVLYKAVSNNRNASDIFFREGPGAYLAGSLSALMAEKTPGTGPPAVSMVGSYRHVDENVRDSFREGARAAVPTIRVFEKESDTVDQAVCEKIADQQVDRGSRVVYVDAGACSPGALDAVEARGVWGIAANQDPSDPMERPWILGSTTKSFGQAVDYAIQSYLDHTLPPGGHRDIPIKSHAADFAPSSTAVPAGVLARLEDVKKHQLKAWEATWLK